MNYLYAAIGGLILAVIIFYAGIRYDQSRGAQHLAVENTKAAPIQQALDQKQAQIQTKTVYLTHTVTKYVDRYIPAPGAASIARPVYLLTNGSLYAWNAALTDPTPGALTTPPNPYNLSPVSFDDAETNAIANFGILADCRARYKAWQDWYKAVK